MSADNYVAMVRAYQFLLTAFGNIWNLASQYWITAVPFVLYGVRKAYQLYRRVRG